MGKNKRRLSRPQQIVLMDWLRSIDDEVLAGMMVSDVAAMEKPDVIAGVAESSIRGMLNDLKLTYKRRSAGKRVPANHHARQAVLAQSLITIATTLAGAGGVNVLSDEQIESLRLIAHSKRIPDEDTTDGTA